MASSHVLVVSWREMREHGVTCVWDFRVWKSAQDGRSNWLKGLTLVLAYAIVAGALSQSSLNTPAKSALHSFD